MAQPPTEPESVAPGRKTRNDPRRERTRAKLLEAATELVHKQGLSELSVSAIARRAGLKQSLFYYHFDSLDECLAEAGRQIVAQLAPLDRATRLNLSWSRGVTPALVRFHEDALDRWLAAGPLVELLIAHRLDGSAFGRAMQPHMDGLRDELTAEVWERMAALGASGDRIAEVRLIADQLVSNWYWALEVLIRGRSHDRSALARQLAESGDQLVWSAFRRMLGLDLQGIMHRRFSTEARAALAAGARQLRDRIRRLDDGDLIAAYGGSEALVDLAISAMANGYLPELCTVRCSVEFRIAAAAETFVRPMSFDHEGCRSTPPDVVPDATLSMSLRTLLQIVSGLSDANRAIAHGELVVQGNRAAAAQLVRCFYDPEDLADR